MGRKPRVDRSPEEKWQIVQEGIKSGTRDDSQAMRPLVTRWLIVPMTNT